MPIQYAQAQRNTFPSQQQPQAQPQAFEYPTTTSSELSADANNVIGASTSPSSSAQAKEKKQKKKQKKRRSWFGNSNKAEDNEIGDNNGNQIPREDNLSPGIVDGQMLVTEHVQSSPGTYINDGTAGHTATNINLQAPTIPVNLHPKKLEMKADRKAKMAGAATTGAIVGAVLTGPAWPVGAMAGAAIGSCAAKVTSRAGERRQQRKWEQKTFNDYIAKGQASVQSDSVSFA